jgi:hypothetical protein
MAVKPFKATQDRWRCVKAPTSSRTSALAHNSVMAN